MSFLSSRINYGNLQNYSIKLYIRPKQFLSFTYYNLPLVYLPPSSTWPSLCIIDCVFDGNIEDGITNKNITIELSLNILSCFLNNTFSITAWGHSTISFVCTINRNTLMQLSWPDWRIVKIQVAPQLPISVVCFQFSFVGLRQREVWCPKCPVLSVAQCSVIWWRPISKYTTLINI